VSGAGRVDRLKKGEASLYSKGQTPLHSKGQRRRGKTASSTIKVRGEKENATRKKKRKSKSSKDSSVGMRRDGQGGISLAAFRPFQERKGGGEKE